MNQGLSKKHKAPRQSALLRGLARHPGEWQSIAITDEMRETHHNLRHCSRIYANNKHEVQCFELQTDLGGVWQFCIFRHGNIEDTTWQDAQNALHELFGPEVVAVEMYPAIEHEWDLKIKMKVLWILPTTFTLPFGLHLGNAWGQHG